MQERANPSSAEDLRASLIKEKRLGRFSPFDLQSKSEQRKSIFEKHIIFE